MKNSPDLFGQHGGRAVLLSVLPQYAKAIAAGDKSVEFRRRWTTESVALLLIYATAPISRVVCLARVRNVAEAPPTALWSYAKEYGGGVTRRELYTYMQGKRTGFAIVLDEVEIFDPPIEPKHLDKRFRAPQSFRFMSADELRPYIRILKRQGSDRKW